ncbi:MAG: MFS transporter [Treponema sp.]|nr:MFS transporter [Treponema sp.]
MNLTYRHTRYACYTGYITQAIVNNLAPLFFIIFSETYSVSYRGLGSLVMLNFMVQLGVDAVCIKLAAKIGYKPLLVAAQAISTAGLVLLGLLPLLITPVFTALAISVVVYAIGGGLLEVLVSPVIDGIPADAGQKPAAMSFLHSFYCWGQMAVILLTTFLLSRFGLGNWFALPFLWAVIPFANMFLFIKAPMVAVLPSEKSTGIRKMAGQPVFYLSLLLMLCAGASEQTVAQWASLFAEKALNLPKVAGDICGPALFALFMGTGRVIYGLWGAKIKIFPYMIFSAGLCVACYLCLGLAPYPPAQLAACALTGFSVSIMWPAVLSLSSARFPLGGSALFAILALMGDLGCGSGPWIAGLVSGYAGTAGNQMNGLQTGSFLTSSFLTRLQPLNAGLLACIVFPVLFLIAAIMFRNKNS